MKISNGVYMLRTIFKLDFKILIVNGCNYHRRGGEEENLVCLFFGSWNKIYN
jgi:hypothetical protein